MKRLAKAHPLQAASPLPCVARHVSPGFPTVQEHPQPCVYAASSMPFASRAPLPCPRWIGARAAKRLVAGGRAPRHPAALAPAAAATPLLVQDVSPQVGSVRVWRGGLFAGGQAPRHPVAHAAPAAAVCAKFSSSGGVGARAAQRLVAGGQLLQRSGVQRRASPYHPLPQLCILLAQLVHLWRQAKKL